MPLSVLDTVRYAAEHTNMTDEQKHWPVVAMIAGPMEVVEIVVRKAERTAGFPMNWGYVAGRGIIHSQGDLKKARSALWMALPQSDLSLSDMI